MIRHPRGTPAPTAIAIGSFDGVHRGHAAILERVIQEAGARGLTPAVLTFEPLPREFFSPQTAPARLTSLYERLTAIAEKSIRLAYIERFDARFASLTPQEFARRLREQYGARWVMVGRDFRYGAKRAGDVASLREAGRELGFEVAVLPRVVWGVAYLKCRFR